MAPSNQANLQKTIVCFMFDGSEKYTRMTLNAVNSFIAATPAVSVGALFPKNFDSSPILKKINDITRVSIRHYEQQFNNWNPTQHKLDIAKFSDEFESIFWLDSDAIVYKDLSDLLLEFYDSPCKVAFLKDHVCWNPQFLNSWAEFRHRTDPFVPQACFMGFKREIIHEFFAEWKETWRQWIEPVPFTSYPNPLPHFPGSAFCTEQYALGMVLEGSLVKPEEVFVIRRLTFPLKTVPGVAADGVTISPNSSFDIRLSSYSMSEKDLNEHEIRLMTTKMSFTSIAGGSFSGMWAQGGSFGSFGSFSGPYVNFSGPSFSLTSYSGPFFEFGSSFGSFSGLSFGGLFDTSFGGSFSTSFGGSFSTSFGGSFSTSFGGSFSSSYGSSYLSSGSSALAGLLSSGALSSYSGSGMASSGNPGSFWVPVDNIAGGIVHFYSTFYDQSIKWWESNRDDVIPRLGDYWKEDDKQ